MSVNRYEVTLNGVSMASLHPSIVITDVQYEPASYGLETYTIAKRQGARISRKHKDRAAVSISFMVRAYNTAERQSIVQDIISWARNGGDLRINDRPGQFLQCICEQLPGVDTVRGWTSEMSITFAAYAIPYWQSVNYTTLTISTTETSYIGETGTIYVPGNAPLAFVEVDVAVDNESALSGFWIEFPDVDPTGLNFQDPTMFKVRTDGRTGENAHFIVSYDENGILSVVKEYDSGGEHRSSSYLSGLEGCDEIVVPCGETSTFRCVGIKTWGEGGSIHEWAKCDFTLKVRGLWE